MIRVEDLPKIAAENGWGACAITDHGAIEGVPAFLKASKKYGIKPIVGCEIYVGCADTYHWEGKHNRKEKLNHLTILCKNAKGFSSLMELLSIGHRDYYDARRHQAAIPVDLVLERLRDCIVLSGCYSSPLWRGTEQAAEDLIRFSERFGDDFYLEVQPHHDWQPQIDLNRMILEMSDSLKIPFAVTPDCHYGHAHEETFHDSLIAVSARMFKEDPKRTWRFSTKQCFIKTPEQTVFDMERAGFNHSAALAALQETGKIAEKIEPWSWNDLPAPRFPDMGGDMQPIVERGFDNKGLRGRPEYESRLATELKTFKEAGLDRYLLLVKHCVDVFHQNGAEIGPRGSVGGSLVAYCLGLTPLDPISHGLSWERFYAPGRRGWPDVDIDLDEETRERAPEILRKEFGSDRVAQISNYSEFGLRMAIRDAAKAYGVAISDNSTGDVSEKKYEDIEDIPPGKELARKSADAATFARMLVGRVRQFGAHAGGFVISADPLTTGRAAIVHRGKDTALPWDMKTAEELGFIKLDFLGLDALSAIKKINETINVNWKDVPLDDEAVYKDFSEGLTAGVPQFLSSGLRSFIRQIKPTKFDDLVWSTSAFRPGALGQRTPDELARAYRKDPDEILVFQEDVMKLCVECAGFTWTEADDVRKTMAKSKGVEDMAKWTDSFVNGCVKTIAADPQTAREFWEKLLNFGRYAFNRCVSGDTVVERGGAGGNNAKATITVCELYKAQSLKTPWGRKIRRGGVRLLAMDDDGRIRPRRLKAVHRNGIKSVVEIVVENGRSIKVTLDHRLLTSDGYVEAGKIAPGTELVVSGEYEKTPYRPTGNPKHRGHGVSYGPRCGVPDGESNPGWIDGRSAMFEQAKTAVLERADDRCELCGGHREGRFEFAHGKSLEDCNGRYDLYHSSANIRLACNPCHKRFDYEKGERRPRWSKGRPTLTSRVVSVKPAADEMTYDVEMQDEPHNFVANGIVSHNSHAVAYAWNSYRIAWAKRHHPAETFLAMLKSEEDNRQPIIDEAHKFGITISAPDPNRSNLDWKADGNTILMPLQMADGVDLRIAKLILTKRGTKPFVDEEDVKKRLVGYKYPDHMIKSLFSGRMPGQNFVYDTFNPRGIFTKKDLDEFVKTEACCNKCPFAQKEICQHGVVPIEFGTSNIMVVGEAPGWDESKKHRPFVGPSGHMLEGAFLKHGVNPKRLSWTNVSHCKPPFIAQGADQPMTRAKADEYAAACPWLDDEIKFLKPPLILAVGKKAWGRLVSTRDSITKVNATVRDVNGTKIVGCLHPAFVMRDDNRRPDFEAAIEKFAELCKILYPDDTPERRLPEEVSMAVKARAILGKRT
jgi:uracil-DNA glycosylase family 4